MAQIQIQECVLKHYGGLVKDRVEGLMYGEHMGLELNILCSILGSATRCMVLGKSLYYLVALVH